MPMITVRYATAAAGEGVDRTLASVASKLAAEHLRKDPKVTAVLVERANPRSWFVAGENLADKSVSAYWVDIKVTAGTNTKDETTALVQAAHRAMREVLGPVHEESYVLVHAVDGHAYGFGGRTQEGRWSAAHPA